jgi:hypothetical protein
MIFDDRGISIQSEVAEFNRVLTRLGVDGST